MNRIAKRISFEFLLLFVMIAVLVLAGAIGCNNAAPKLKSTAPAPAGFQQPPQPFLDQWADFVKLRAEIQDIQKKNGLQEKIDQLNGMATRLQSQVPQGFKWDEPSLTFAPVISPPPVPVPGPPPAPPAKK